LYPLYLYFIAINVQSLEPGVYCYVPHGHRLQLLAALPSGLDLGKLAGFGEIEYAKAGLIFMYVYRLYENSRKYGDLGLSFALIEAGATAQNIHLAATAMGVGSCDVGGYKKRACERLIAVDGLSEHVVHMTVVGK
jgi:SagB-type dehydrogenase family enzyme